MNTIEKLLIDVNKKQLNKYYLDDNNELYFPLFTTPNHKNYIFKQYSQDIYCYNQMWYEIDHRLEMRSVFNQLNKIFVKKALKLLNEIDTKLNYDVLCIIGSYISGTNGTLLKQINLL